MVIRAFVLIATLMQEPAPATAVCRLTLNERQWVGSCGKMFGGEPSLAVSPTPAVSTGTWRPGAKPIAVWAGEMKFEGGAVPVEIEVYSEGPGLLRSGVNWALITRFATSDDVLQFELDISRPVPPSAFDRAIVRRAAEIIASESVWDRADDRICDVGDRAWSIYCAMHRAIVEITGGFSHRRPALQVVREIITERSAGRNYAHRIQDYNNDRTTRLADVRSLFAEAASRINRTMR